jgi:hypothetical protein
MRKQILCSGGSVVGMALLYGLSACTTSHGKAGAKDAGRPDAGVSPTDTGVSPTDTGVSPTDSGVSPTDTGVSPTDTGASPTDAGCMNGDPSKTYVLIDDMETTTHGPIQFATGIAPPLSQGYWYNSGASYSSEAGADTSDPPQLSFVFSALPAATNTLNCKASAHAARQFCSLNGLYDTCGVGLEFAQVPDADAGAATTSDAGDAGPIPMVTVPFDISRYKAITFWGMTTTPDPTSGSLHVKVQFPDTDTDPRGQVCNGGGGNTSKCYNSYAAYLEFTTSWQEFTVLLDAGGGDGGVAPAGGIAIDKTWGYQQAQWIPTQVYGINWQAQRNIEPDAGPPLETEIWVDDVYFVE